MRYRASAFEIVITVVILALMGWVYELKTRTDRLDFEMRKHVQVIERIEPECIGPEVEEIRIVAR